MRRNPADRAPESLENYYRYDGSISRDYYRAIASLERMQAGRRREEDRQERKARQEASQCERIVNHPDPDTVAEISPEPPAPRQVAVNNGFNPSGFVSYYEPSGSVTEPNAGRSAKELLPTLQEASHRNKACGAKTKVSRQSGHETHRIFDI